MFRRPRPDEVPEERPVFTKGERIGSAVAHAAPLLLGVPLFPLLGGLGIAMPLLPCPILAYLISRSFRRRQSAWGAFQGMQAVLVQLILLVLIFTGTFLDGSALAAAIPQIPLTMFVVAFLLFLYTLWGAWDCAWGYDFRYILLSNFVDRVTAANLRRQEGRQQRPASPPDRSDRR